MLIANIAGGVLLGLGAIAIIGNLGVIVRVLITKKSSSLMPPVGALLAFVGCALVSSIGWRLGLLALLIDPGCALTAVLLSISLLFRR